MMGCHGSVDTAAWEARRLRFWDVTGWPGGGHRGGLGIGVLQAPPTRDQKAGMHSAATEPNLF